MKLIFNEKMVKKILGVTVIISILLTTFSPIMIYAEKELMTDESQTVTLKAVDTDGNVMPGVVFSITSSGDTAKLMEATNELGTIEVVIYPGGNILVEDENNDQISFYVYVDENGEVVCGAWSCENNVITVVYPNPETLESDIGADNSDEFYEPDDYGKNRLDLIAISVINPENDSVLSTVQGVYFLDELDYITKNPEFNCEYFRFDVFFANSNWEINPNDFAELVFSIDKYTIYDIDPEIVSWNDFDCIVSVNLLDLLNHGLTFYVSINYIPEPEEEEISENLNALSEIVMDEQIRESNDIFAVLDLKVCDIENENSPIENALYRLYLTDQSFDYAYNESFARYISNDGLDIPLKKSETYNEVYYRYHSYEQYKNYYYIELISDNGGKLKYYKEEVKETQKSEENYCDVYLNTRYKDNYRLVLIEPTKTDNADYTYYYSEYGNYSLKNNNIDINTYGYKIIYVNDIFNVWASNGNNLVFGNNIITLTETKHEWRKLIVCVIEQVYGYDNDYEFVGDVKLELSLKELGASETYSNVYIWEKLGDDDYDFLPKKLQLQYLEFITSNEINNSGNIQYWNETQYLSEIFIEHYLQDVNHDHYYPPYLLRNNSENVYYHLKITYVPDEFEPIDTEYVLLLNADQNAIQLFEISYDNDTPVISQDAVNDMNFIILTRKETEYIPMLPSTGGNGADFHILIGSVLIITAAFIYIRKLLYR